jgi:hypothetical protein
VRAALVALVCISSFAGNTQSQPLTQLANQRAQQYQRESERFAAEQQFFSGFQFSRYSALGHPLFLSTLNLPSAQATGTASLSSGQSGMTLRGEGMQIAAWDDGLVAPHRELDTRVVANEGTQAMTHASHVAGTLIATGLNAAARGMAPGAQLLAFRFDNDEAEMAALASTNNKPLLVSNHSYGTVTGWTSQGGTWRWVGDPAVSNIEDYQFGLYTAKAQLLDAIAFEAPQYTICWAAGNDRGEPGDGSRPPDCNGGTGYDCIIPDAVAKNIITVGAIDPLTAYTSPASVAMSSYSSWGPTDDGRIKPDLVGVGTNVFSLSAAPPDGYTVLSGTSMATPNVAGSLLLLQELHQKLFGGRAMRAATLKALAIHTAKEAGAFPGPDYRFGWGLLDTQAAATLLTQHDGIQTIVQENTLQNGETRLLNLNPQAGRKIAITIVWTDPPGVPAPIRLDPSELALVNDLDVRLTDDQGTTHLPWTLNPANPGDRAGRGDNTRDNVEKLELDQPLARSYQLRVSHKGTLARGSQAYSIIVTYTAVTSVRTLYWIGDEGNWNDATKWSFASGGVAAFTIPTSNDRIIIDENSFNEVGENAIQLMTPVTVRSLTWLSTKKAGLKFNGNPLTVSQELKIASSDFQGTDGVIQFFGQVSTQNTVDFFQLNGSQLRFRFLAGNWRLTGRGKVKTIEVNAARLDVSGARIESERWLASPSSGTQWNFADSEIRISNELSIVNANRLAVTSTQTSLILKGDVRFVSSELVWPVTTALDSGRVTLDGVGNRFKSFRVSGWAMASGVNQFDRLHLATGTLSLAAGTRQQVADLQLDRSTTLLGAMGATVELLQYRKFCFDAIRITDVALVGKGVASVGLSSTLLNATGWQSTSCDNTLFADFNVQFPCAGGQAKFAQAASGNPTTFSWEFQQADQVNRESTSQANVSFPMTGSARVRLIVSRAGLQHQRDSIVEIRANALAENQILATSERLNSLVTGDRYEWYRDQQPLNGQTERFLVYNGEPGAYQVLTFREYCNRWSPVYTVTNVLEAFAPVTVYPNPASDQIFIQTSEEVQAIQIFDVAGRTALQTVGSSADVRQLSAGLYVCEVRTANRQARVKILIHR